MAKSQRRLSFSAALALLLILAHISRVRMSQSDQPDPIGSSGSDLQTGGCDLLFMANDNLASYCHCKDASQPDGSREIAALADSKLAHISQLACSPQNFTQIKQDLAALDGANLAGSFAAHNSTSPSGFKVDFLGISANLSEAEIAGEVDSRRRDEAARASSSPDQQAKLGSLLIDHISLQLSATFAEVGAGESRVIEEQMIDFVRLINETHLQFLSIFIEQQQQQQQPPGKTGNGGHITLTGEDNLSDGNAEIKLDRLLAKLAALERLELSLADVNRGELLLFFDSKSFRQQNRLKWLNLASNNRLRLAGAQMNDIIGADYNQSPFQWTPNIEYLSLESCNLSSFPLFSMFQVPFKLTTKFTQTKHDELYSNAASTFYGMPNLTSLNLANNKLASFESNLFTSSGGDLFASACRDSSSWKKSDEVSKVFLLPLLTQLDLSYNKLNDLTFKVGQFILCTMPNLNQLYLQKNKIIQLNLNSLLAFPFHWPRSIYYNSTEELPSPSPLLAIEEPEKVTRYSRLEYIDVSHNQLNTITALQQPHDLPQVRLKSINFSHNKLKLPLLYVDFNSMNRVVFRESFDNDNANMNTLNNLQSSFVDLGDNIPSLCDLLSPKSGLNLDELLLNEVILSNNAFERISKEHFYSSACKDVQILRISNNRIAHIEDDSLFTLQNLEQLELNDNRLENLSENLFVKNSKLRILNLANNKISYFNRKIFLHLVDLEELFIKGNTLTELPSEIFAHNSRLNVIDLSQNKLVKLESATFADLKQLRILDLSNNRLKQFSHHLFETLPGIVVNSDNVSSSVSKKLNHKSSQQIESKSKKLKTVKSNNQSKSNKKARIKRSLEELNSIDLSSNQIDLVQLEKCFYFSESTQILRLDDNKLEDLIATSFKCLPSVQMLYLQSNQIRNIAETTFSNMSDLEYVDISRNQISFIQARTFSFSNVLRHVDLNNNRLLNFRLMDIFTIKGPIGSYLAPVESLSLNDNPNLNMDVNDLTDFIFQSSLRELKLGNIQQIQQTRQRNQTARMARIHLDLVNISSIHFIDDAFINTLSEPLVTIDKLDVGHVDINSDRNKKGVEQLALTKLQGDLKEMNLENIGLDEKQLIEILGSLSIKSKLINLNLASNFIETWPFDPKLAENLSELKYLDISENKLRYLIRNEPTIYRFPNLEVLNLSSNALIGLFERTMPKTVELGDWLPQLRWLDLSNNRLTWLPIQFFQNLNELTWLRLDHNQLETFPLIISNSRLVIDLRLNQRLSSLALTHKTSVKELADDDLVLLSDRSDARNLLECRSIVDYINNYVRVNSALKRDELQEELDEDRVEKDRCSNLMRFIDTIVLDSTSAGPSLLTSDTIGTKYTHLSFRKSGLKLETISIAPNIVMLDLSDNRIQDLERASCERTSNLKSLDLSTNQLKIVPVDLVLSCRKLNYLDLSHNRIGSIGKIKSLRAGTSSLQVLNLRNNLLTDISGLEVNIFKSLQHIELSSNRIKANHFVPSLGSPLLYGAIADVSQQQEVVKGSTPKIKLTRDSLIFNWPTEKSYRDSYSFNMKRNDTNDNFTTISDENFQHVIKFCTLNHRDSMQVCVDFENKHKRCFYVKTPQEVPSCLTDLDKENSKSQNRSYRAPVNSIPLISGAHENIEEDSVLQFINNLKKNWLKLRDMNVNEYLTSFSNISSDSVLFNLNGTYPIHTMLVMKWAIVLSALCIVGLLIAMFMLLTRKSIYQDELSPKGGDKFMNVTNETDTSSSSINKTTSSTHSDSYNVQAGLNQTTSSSIGSDSRTSKNDISQQQTIVERKVSLHLDANQLLQQQNCSTPSLSLAPSSVETAETMQAVDSIKSNGSILYSEATNKTSVDHYAERKSNTNLPQRPSQQVATVMRMIKSNSANFDATNNSRPGSSYLYGTVNPRYSTLKSKICSIHEHQQQRHQVYPIQIPEQQQPLESFYQQNQYLSAQNYPPAPSPYMESKDKDDLSNKSTNESGNLVDQEQDPTTISLISINTALSNCFRTSASQQVSPASLTPGQQQQQQDQNSNLCHYHRLVREPQTEAILEQDEHCQGLLQVGSIPQPPSIRTLEVLEGTLLDPSDCYKTLYYQ